MDRYSIQIISTSFNFNLTFQGDIITYFNFAQYHIRQVKNIAEEYYCTNQEHMASFTNTLKQVRELTQKYRKLIASEITNSKETLADQFDGLVEKAETGNKVLQGIKSVCKPTYSVLAFWQWGSSNKKDCFGYNIPDLDPNKVLNEKLGSNNVREALTGVIQIIDPMEDVSKLEVNGKHY